MYQRNREQSRSFLGLTAICVFIAFLVITAISKANEPRLNNPAKWQSTISVDNPLVGKLWSKKAGSFVDPATLIKELKSKKFIMLGETHDNPDHHILQARVIEALVAMGRKPNIVMEMINVDQMRRLSQFRSFGEPKAEYLGRALRWKSYGWPDYKIYQPIGEQILRHDLKVFPGSPSIRMTRTIIKRGYEILPEKAIEIFKLNNELDDVLHKALLEELRVSHCNKLPEKLIDPMSNIQRFRDAWMADVLIQAESKDTPAVLIAGSGHTRTDRGAPWYLNLRDEKTSYVSIQFLEVSAEQTKLEQSANLDPDGKIAADYVWVTPTVKRPDPCANFKPRNEKAKE